MQYQFRLIQTQEHRLFNVLFGNIGRDQEVLEDIMPERFIIRILVAATLFLICSAAIISALAASPASRTPTAERAWRTVQHMTEQQHTEKQYEAIKVSERTQD